MPRRRNLDLIKPWKVSLPATTAGRMEFLLLDTIHNKPLYGTRARLIDTLLNMWMDSVQGKPVREFPSIDEVRNY